MGWSKFWTGVAEIGVGAVLAGVGISTLSKECNKPPKYITVAAADDDESLEEEDFFQD